LKTKTKSKGKHIPWNKGKLIGQKLPLTLKGIRAIRSRLRSAQQTRDLVLFNLAIDSNLHACDLVQLRVRDISKGRHVASRVTIMQLQTNRPVQFEITDETRESVAAWIAQEKLKPDHHLFPSRISDSPHISTRQYARVVVSWVSLIGLDPGNYGTQSLRRTKPMLIYRRTKNLEAVQLLLGHTKLRNTVRFLGIEGEA
jgi:integrase